MNRICICRHGIGCPGPPGPGNPDWFACRCPCHEENEFLGLGSRELMLQYERTVTGLTQGTD